MTSNNGKQRKIDAEMKGLAKLKKNAQVTTMLKYVLTALDGDKDNNKINIKDRDDIKLHIVKKGGNKFIFGGEEAFYAGDGACQLVGEGKFLFAMGIFMLYGNGRILFRKRIILIWKKKDFI